MITEMTQTNIEEIMNSDIPTVVEFYSPDCTHCKRTEKGIIELDEELGNRVQFVKCNIFEQKSLAELYDVTMLPTLLFVKNGDVKDKLVGFTHKLIIAENLKKISI